MRTQNTKTYSSMTQNKRAEIKFFNRFEKGSGYDVFDASGNEKIIDNMKKEIKAGKGSIIYDMGCGSGVFTHYIAKAYPKSKVIGLDISTGCISKAKKDYPKIDFRVGDVEATKIKSSSVDVVCYTGIFHHFADFSRVANEAYRILKPGGRIFSYDPNFFNPPFWLYRSKSSPFYSSVGVTENERLLKTSEIITILKNEGFEIKTKVISGIKFSYVESKKARLLLSVYNFMDQLLAITPFASLFGSFILGFGKKK